ncbi:hypothetical protein GF357_04735, partial [Candidatus Dojkabacteria bacterium]|nr:hypothetical protein [Candidatus Dojkabacteria bacterium]
MKISTTILRKVPIFLLVICFLKIGWLISLKSDTFAYTDSDEPVFVDVIKSERDGDYVKFPTHVEQNSESTFLVSEYDVIQERNFRTGELVRVLGLVEGDAALSSPRGIGIGEGGVIYVADSGANAVKKYSADFELLDVWTGFNQPFGIAVIPGDSQAEEPYTDKIFVTNSGANNVSVIIGDELQETTLSWDSKVGALNDPRGITTDSSGNLYLADGGNNRVIKVESNLVDASEFLSPSASMSPSGVHMTSDGNLLVTRTGNSVVCEYLTLDASQVFCYGTYNQMFYLGGTFWNPYDAIEFVYYEDGEEISQILVVDRAVRRLAIFQPGINSVYRQISSGAGELLTPYGMFYTNQKLHVIDMLGNSLQMLNLEDNTWEKIGQAGHSLGEFSLAQNVSVDIDGNIYIADTHNQRIQKLDQNKNVVMELVTWMDGETSDSFSYPSDVVTDSNGNIYVADVFSNRVVKFTSAGEYSEVWPLSKGPTDIYIDREIINDQETDRIYVVVQNSHKVVKYDTDGNALMTMGGTQSADDGLFYRPTGVSVDSNGDIYVADTRNNRMQVLNSAGVFKTKWTLQTYGSGDPNPCSVVLDDDDYIYVSETKGANVQIYKFDRAPAEFEYAHSSAKSYSRNGTGTFTATAVDELTAITSVEYSMNNGSTWNTCKPVDGTLDNKEEEFTCSFTDLNEGIYDILYRSTDSKTNTNDSDTYGSQQLIVDWTPPVFEEVEEDDDGRLNVYEGKIVDDNPFKLRAYPGDELSGVDYVEFYVDDVL